MATIGVALVVAGAAAAQQGNTGAGAILIILGLVVFLMAKWVEE